MLLAATAGEAQTDITVRDDKTGKDESIEMPVSMTLDIDTLLHQWNASQYLETDSNCNMQDVNPIFADSVYIDRLSRIPAVMELPYNSIVRKFIDQYSGRLRRSVSYMLGATNFYIPLFEEALALYNLPLELKYLPVIESALDPTAVSRKGATGLWQFMLPTAKRYGLKINSLVDERRDPVKATYAAAQYLSELYNLYDDWSLVIAAYNCGPNSLNKAIHRAGGSKDYWTVYPYLPKETRGYVPAFIAANYIMEYYCDHNICPMRAKGVDLSDTVVVSRDLSLEQVAAVCGVDMEQLRSLNPQYKTAMVPGASYECILRLPPEAALRFVDLGDSVYNFRSDELLTKRKTVEVDEQAVARQASSSSSGRRSSSRRSSRRRSSGRTVTVKSGQTLSELAEKYNTSVSKLRRLNGIKGSSIRAGKKLRVR